MFDEMLFCTVPCYINCGLAQTCFVLFELLFWQRHVLCCMNCGFAGTSFVLYEYDFAADMFCAA